MTIRDYSNPVTVWHVEVIHDGWFADWPLEKDYDWVHITAKGYPSRFMGATFQTKKEATRFLEINREIIEGRCRNRSGYLGLRVASHITFETVPFDKAASIKRVGKRGPGRDTLLKRSAR